MFIWTKLSFIFGISIILLSACAQKSTQDATAPKESSAAVASTTSVAPPPTPLAAGLPAGWAQDAGTGLVSSNQQDGTNLLVQVEAQGVGSSYRIIKQVPDVTAQYERYRVTGKLEVERFDNDPNKEEGCKYEFATFTDTGNPNGVGFGTFNGFIKENGATEFTSFSYTTNFPFARVPEIRLTAINSRCRFSKLYWDPVPASDVIEDISFETLAGSYPVTTAITEKADASKYYNLFLYFKDVGLPASPIAGVNYIKGTTEWYNVGALKGIRTYAAGGVASVIRNLGRAVPGNYKVQVELSTVVNTTSGGYCLLNFPHSTGTYMPHLVELKGATVSKELTFAIPQNYNVRVEVSSYNASCIWKSAKVTRIR